MVRDIVGALAGLGIAYLVTALVLADFGWITRILAASWSSRLLLLVLGTVSSTSGVLIARELPRLKR